MFEIKNPKGVLVTAVVMAAVGVVVHTLETMLTMGYYVDPAYSQVWSKLMMPKAGPPPVEFMLASIAVAFFTWLFFAIAYSVLSDSIKEKNPMCRGRKFGALAFLLAGIPTTLMLWLLINLPMGIIAAWTVSSFLLYMIGGMVAAKFISK